MTEKGMPDGNPENELRDLFNSATAPNTLNADRIIAKSRARRLPKQLASGAVGALAIAGIFVVGINAAQLTNPPATISAEDSQVSGGAAESSIKRAPAEKLNLCGGALAEVAPSNYGLRLDVDFPAAAPAGTAPIEGTVTLTNTSAQRIAGTTAAVAALTLSQNGIVKWHSNGPMIVSLVVVDLEPGQSLEYRASVTPVLCDIEDDSAESFRENLPALTVGDYELSAAIDFSVDPQLASNDMPELDLITGPRSPITLTP